MWPKSRAGRETSFRWPWEGWQLERKVYHEEVVGSRVRRERLNLLVFERGPRGHGRKLILPTGCEFDSRSLVGEATGGHTVTGIRLSRDNRHQANGTHEQELKLAVASMHPAVSGGQTKCLVCLVAPRGGKMEFIFAREVMRFLQIQRHRSDCCVCEDKTWQLIVNLSSHGCRCGGLPNWVLQGNGYWRERQ